MHLSAVRVCSSSVHVKITVLHSVYMYWLTKKNLLRYTHVGFQISAWAPGTLLPFLEVWGRHYWWDYSWNTQRTWKNNASVLRFNICDVLSYLKYHNPCIWFLERSIVLTVVLYAINILGCRLFVMILFKADFFRSSQEINFISTSTSYKQF